MIELADVSKGDRVLDIACGTGEPGLTFAKQMPSVRVMGIDLSEEMVRIANEKANVQDLKNYEAEATDGVILPFANESMDAILCRLGVMFFPDPVANLQEFWRVLKNGGKAIASVWNAPEKNPWATTIGQIVQQELNLPKPDSNEPGIFRFAQEGALTSLFEKAGFARVEQIELQGKRFFESPEQYWQFMTEVSAPIAGALKQTNDATMARIQRAVIDQAKSFDKGGRVEFSWSSWVVCGVRPGIA